jgi:hypothetical protein
MSINDYQIYEFLRSHFPGEYLPLRKIPKALDHPGNQPKSPKKTETLSFTIDANTDFASLAKELEHIIARGKREATFVIHHEVIGTETLTDDWEGYEYESTVYGEANKIVFQAVVESENLNLKLKQHKTSVNEWARRVDARRERKDQREFLVQQNNGQIFTARNDNLDLWRLAAKSLSGKLDTDFKNIVRDRLLDRLRELDAN